MACKMTVAAAACILILSFILPSDVEAVSIRICPPRNSEKVIVCDTQEECKGRCQYQGYAGGFCDAKHTCSCIDTKCG
ncbi:hypothetical protein BS78_05G216500 [Paspalum vaginatum]|nr:hypothetical protein BS78_05G216500 [Paspalum vaginatum]KAJ1276461.1 hypothetical protein BS78_05G216500 [Paspalum vaginatum]